MIVDAAPARTYEALRAEFRWRHPGAVQHRDGDGRAPRRPAARRDGADRRGRGGHRSTLDVRGGPAAREQAVERARGAGPASRATGWRSSCSQGHETAVAHLAAYRAGLIAVPLFVLFGPDALEYRLRDSGATRDRHRRGELAEGRRDPRPAARSCGRRSSSAARGIDGTLDFEAALARASRRFRAPRHGGRRPGDHHLHVGHDRAAEGRAARPSLSARPPAGRPAAARLPAATRRPVLDAGRLGLDRRPVRRALPGVVLGPAGRRASRAQVRPGARVRPHGASRHPQRVPAADGAEAAAPVGRAGAGRAAAAVGRQRRRDARRGIAGVGPRDPGRDDQRVLRPDRMQPRRLEFGRDHAGQGRARWAGRCPVTRSPSSRRTAAGCRPARSARSRSADRIP